MIRAVVVTSLLLISSPIAHADAVHDVVKAEQDFDAYTAIHGFTHGFHYWSAEDGVTIGPKGPRPIHKLLSDAIAKDPSESDAPSKLRWWPLRAAASSSGDLGWDLGGWKNGDDPNGGWYFTIWAKQADGSWRWMVDTGAGKAPLTEVPDKTALITDPVPVAKSQTALADIESADTALDTALASASPPAYAVALAPDTIFGGPEGPPAIFPGTWTEAIAKRPAGVWQRDFIKVSAAGDLGYTYGHAGNQGTYLRVWRNDGEAGWHIVADIFQPAAK
ncbi:MAG: nuclear transport factor 2 family protein [Asticcacaulis sp.]|nr:nuclear transport factor 2 family protein [Asticcacaulis sp.]